MEGLCFLNGQWISLEQASLSISDLAVVRGYGVFDYLRTYGGRPFHVLDHLLRLKKSAAIIGLALPYSFEEIEALINQILEKTNYPETSLKLLLTGGVSEDQFSLGALPTFCIIAYPHQSSCMAQFKEGIRVITTRFLRPLPQAKSTCYLPALAALQEARRQGADDILYVNEDEEILEASTSNIFVVKKGRLITPSSEAILPGITREVLKRCAFPDIDVGTQPLPLSELKSWDEAFLTSSSREVMPVIAIDGKPIGSGKVGPLAQEMLRRFTAYAQTSPWVPLEKQVKILIDILF